jgi:hypothetical protein
VNEDKEIEHNAKSGGRIETDFVLGQFGWKKLQSIPLEYFESNKL